MVRGVTAGRQRVPAGVLECDQVVGGGYGNLPPRCVPGRAGPQPSGAGCRPVDERGQHAGRQLASSERRAGGRLAPMRTATMPSDGITATTCSWNPSAQNTSSGTPGTS